MQLRSSAGKVGAGERLDLIAMLRYSFALSSAQIQGIIPYICRK